MWTSPVLEHEYAPGFLDCRGEWQSLEDMGDE
jgi:hypothetical protein